MRKPSKRPAIHVSPPCPVLLRHTPQHARNRWQFSTPRHCQGALSASQSPTCRCIRVLEMVAKGVRFMPSEVRPRWWLTANWYAASGKNTYAVRCSSSCSQEHEMVPAVRSPHQKSGTHECPPLLSVVGTRGEPRTAASQIRW